MLRLEAPCIVTRIVRRKDNGQPLAGAWVGVQSWPIGILREILILWQFGQKRTRTVVIGVRCGPWEPNLCIYAFAPKGVPCPDTCVGPYPWHDGQTHQEIDIDMKTGTLVHGRILEKGSRKPVAGAAILYMLRRHNTKLLDFETATRIYWANEYHRRYSNADGSFEQPVASGEIGFLMVKAPTSDYVSRYISRYDLQFGEEGGVWLIVEGLAKVEPARDEKEVAMDINPQSR